MVYPIFVPVITMGGSGIKHSDSTPLEMVSAISFCIFFTMLVLGFVIAMQEYNTPRSSFFTWLCAILFLISVWCLCINCLL